MLGNNYNYGMSITMNRKHHVLLKGKHICTRCRRKGTMVECLSYLCMECSVDIYEGR
jgi:hypothetical protein